MLDEGERWRLIEGDCLDVLRAMPAGCVDAVVTDPPYPCIKRSYGYWTETEWFALINPVVEECRRILKPTGSAVFILQPNSERVGRMRTWLWRFMLDWGERWGIVQDAWWWNHCMPPMTKNDPNLLRASLKSCVWLGVPNCYRNSSEVLWAESDANKANRLGRRLTNDLKYGHGGSTTIREMNARTACVMRGGVTPFNVLPINGGGCDSGGHSARTPAALCRWWVRYICPPGGLVLDPFLGSGTTALAAMAEGRRCVGIERNAEYCAIARRRMEEADDAAPLFKGAPA
jgi:site-specific DNA-methyltransferase (adenine-specific)